MLEARDRTADANQAATDVVEDYRTIIKTEAGAASIAVPIRRSPAGPMLFEFTLFYRHPAAAYKFADAAAKGTANWREVFRQKDIEGALAREEVQPSLWGSDQVQEFNVKDAKAREDQLKTDAIAHIEGNIKRLIAPLTSGPRHPRRGEHRSSSRGLHVARRPACAHSRLGQPRGGSAHPRSRQIRDEEHVEALHHQAVTTRDTSGISDQTAPSRSRP